MTVVRSVLLFVLAALAEIGGAWLIWQGWREHRGLWWIAAGMLALGAYGFVATFQPDPHFGRILAAYGGIFVAGALAWGVLVDKFRPDRWESPRSTSLPSTMDRSSTPGVWKTPIAVSSNLGSASRPGSFAATPSCK